MTLDDLNRKAERLEELTNMIEYYLQLQKDIPAKLKTLRAERTSVRKEVNALKEHFDLL